MSSNVNTDRSLAGQVVQALAARIIAGDIAPGAWLRQDELAEEFKTSHVPVREALRRLEAQGLVVMEPRRGVRAAPLDAASIIEVARMRAALEPLALRHALPRFPQGQLARLRECLRAPGPDLDIAGLEAANQQFHTLMTESCGMPRLLATLTDLHQASSRHLFAAWKWLDWRPRSDREHEEILAALQAGAVDDACARLADHILAAGTALAQALAQTGR
ncbi:MAG TPA: GntR family transcriptional regulator [Bordetella sp.]